MLLLFLLHPPAFVMWVIGADATAHRGRIASQVVCFPPPSLTEQYIAIVLTEVEVNDAIINTQSDLMETNFVPQSFDLLH